MFIIAQLNHYQTNHPNNRRLYYQRKTFLNFMYSFFRQLFAMTSSIAINKFFKNNSECYDSEGSYLIQVIM